MTHDHSTSARDVILARVHEALRLPAPLPHGLLEDGAPHPSSAGPAHAGGQRATGLPVLTILPEQIARPWLPDGGDTPAASLALLEKNLTALKAQVLRVADAEAAAGAVASLARERSWQRVAWHAHPLIDPVAAALPCATCRVTPDDFDKKVLETCDAGVTACEALVAQTGSILVSSRTCGGRAISILPHVHVVVATTDQVVGTLADSLHAAKRRHGGHLPSMLSFITGPSRTGDIERILVLGAHGPKELFVVLVG
jgi:L-lactate dehydrogenase complex protein LldG